MRNQAASNEVGQHNRVTKPVHGRPKDMNGKSSRPAPMPRPRLTLVPGEVPGTESQARASEPLDTVVDGLIQAFEDRVLYLFRRRLQGQAGMFPIIAVAASGVHLIEPRAYPGRQIRASDDGSEFLIDGVRFPRLTQTMSDNCDALQAALASGPRANVAMTAAYCMTEGRLPRRRFEVDGVPVFSVKRLTRHLGQRGPWDDRAREEIHLDLSRRLERV